MREMFVLTVFIVRFEVNGDNAMSEGTVTKLFTAQTIERPKR